jgi:hypothetical protein
MFRKLDLFPSSGVGGKHLRTETDSVFETSCSVIPRIPDDGKSPKPSNSECDTPSSEPFRIYFYKIYEKLVLCRKMKDRIMIYTFYLKPETESETWKGKHHFDGLDMRFLGNIEKNLI